MIETVDPDLEALFAYGTGKCHSRAIPCRADINPTEIKSPLPLLFMVEIHQRLRFCFGLVGTASWHEDNPGKWRDELDYEESERGFGAIPNPRSNRRAEMRREGARRQRGWYLHDRRLLLPLAEDGIGPNVLLVGAQKSHRRRSLSSLGAQWI